MSNQNFKCTLLDAGFGIEFNDTKFQLSLEETHLPWKKAKKWCEEHNGVLPTIDQLMILHEHRFEINKMLTDAGKVELAGGYWSDREHSNSPEFAWYVGMDSGFTNYYDKYYTLNVRAVSAFPN